MQGGAALHSRAVKSQKGGYRKAENNDPAVEGVFRIVIQRSLKEMVDLPELKVWSMLPRTVQARMIVRIRRYGFFFTHDSEEALMRCVLTRRNYLIIYAKEKQLKGYAVKLSLAEKINISCGRGEKGRCNMTIKWQFGEISLMMFKEQIADWRSRILEAFEGTTSLPLATHEVGVQTRDGQEAEANDSPKLRKKRSWALFEKFENIPPRNPSTTTLVPSVRPPTEPFGLKKFKETSRLSGANVFGALEKKIATINNNYKSTNTGEKYGEESGEEKDEKQEAKEHAQDDDDEPMVCPWSFRLVKEKISLNNNEGDKAETSKLSQLTSSTISPMTSTRTLCASSQQLVRRSVSSPAIDMKKFGAANRVRINSPPVFGPRSVLFPKRSISRIERPFSTLAPWVPPQTAPWCTLVKRYDFQKTDDANCSNC